MILKKLKEETAARHTSLEQTPLLAHIRNGSLTLAIYSTIVQRFYTFYAPLEEQLALFFEDESHLPDYGSRRKTEALQKDIAYLKANGMEHNFVPYGSCELPSTPQLSHAFGCLYVLEGSTLGGQVISKVLRDTLQIHPDTGGAYFHGYGSQTAERWRTFCAALQQYSSNRGRDQEIVDAANDTFDKFKMCLQ